MQTKPADEKAFAMLAAMIREELNAACATIGILPLSRDPDSEVRAALEGAYIFDSASRAKLDRLVASRPA